MVEDIFKTTELAKSNSYQFSMENGQRFYGPPINWIGFPPENSEVFIGNLPTTIYEYDLVPILSKAGRIYSLKLLQNYSEFDRGFAFVQYYTSEEAKKAIKLLDNYQIEPGHFMSVSKSRKNCRLFVSNLNKCVTKEKLSKIVKSYVDNVVDVYFDPLNKRNEITSKNKGYAYVEFIDHKAADLARKKLLPCKIVFDEQEILVDWVTPINELGENLKEECTLLFKNFKVTLSNEEIYNILSDNHDLEIILFKRLFDQVLVSFKTEENTKQALKNFEGLKDKSKLVSELDAENKLKLIPINEYMNLKIFIDQTNYEPKDINNNKVEKIQKNKLEELLESLNSKDLAESKHLTNKCCFTGNCEIDDFYKFSKIHIWTQQYKSTV